MKKRIWIFAALLMLMMLAVLPVLAEDAIEVKFTIYSGAGETVQPQYPDLSSQIGAGLTQEDFVITYSTNQAGSYYLTVDENTGRITMAEDINSPAWRDVFITYTPKAEGKGVKTVFVCQVYAGRSLKSITLSSTELTLGLDQTSRQSVTLNDFYIIDHLTLEDYDDSVVDVTLAYRSYDKKSQMMTITPKAIGETTITVRGYNGVSASMKVKVCEPPTELSFAQDVYYCYEGEAISLGIRLGEGDVERAANFSSAAVNGNRVTAGLTSKYFLGRDGVMGLFCVDSFGDYTISATTYNGFSDSAVVKVYQKERAVSIKAASEPIRAGGAPVELITYDANGNAVRAMKFAVTKGKSIASITENKLSCTGVGEVEVTVTNYDGTTCSATFQVEAYPTEIFLNAEAVTLEIGEHFDLEVSFDQGNLPHTVSLVEQDCTDQELYTTRMEGKKRIIAQSPGVAVYQVTAGTLSKRITVTVPDSDRAVRIVCPEQPFGVGQSYQFYVKDKAGRIYPATFKTISSADYATITPGGYFTARQSGYLHVGALLDDGRWLATRIEAKQMPKWLKQNAMVLRKSESGWLAVQSDVGNINYFELEIEVANENIVEVSASQIIPKKVGKTIITLTSIYSGVSTTFTVEVISDSDTLHLGTASMYVPLGGARVLPTVYNSNGDPVEMVWKITHNNPGEGNSDASGFAISSDTIQCTWPTASCEVTGTRKGGRQNVKLTVYGYQLPETIEIEPLQVWMELGESQNVSVTTKESGTKIEIVGWYAEPEGIVSVPEVTVGATAPLKALSAGDAIVMAMLENEAYAFCVVSVYDPNARRPGDVDENGEVNIYDALRVMQYSAGWPVPLNGWAGDVNADGKTNLQDALLLLQHSAGLNVELKQYIPAP